MNRKTYVIVSIFFLFLLGLVVFFYYYQKSDISADYFHLDERNYTLFAKPTFDHVYSTTQPAPSDVIDDEGLSVFAARGEIEPLTFSVNSDIDLGKVNVDVSDLNLASSDTVMPSSVVDVNNLKLWEQCSKNGSCMEEGNAKEVPELLVKDNEQDLIADEVGWTGNEYVPPAVNRDFNVEIKKNKTHTFYLRLSVPETATPGDYSGLIKFTPERGEETQFSLNLTVLPFNLPDLEKEYLVYFNKRVGWGAEKEVSWDQYQKYLDIFQESNIKGLVSWDSKLHNIDRITKAMKDRQIDSKYIQVLYIRNEEEQAKAKDIADTVRRNGLEPYFYTVDEPVRESEMKTHLRKINKIQEIGEKAMTAIRYECNTLAGMEDFYLYDELDDIEPIQDLDLPNFQLGNRRYPCCTASDQSDIVPRLGLKSFPQYIEALQKGEIEKSDKEEFYYAQIWREEALKNRIWFGFFLWNSKLDGVVPFGVSSGVSSNDDPRGKGLKFYDDFDGQTKAFASLYPTDDKPLITLQWEGYRKGIDDVRYLTKLDQLLTRFETIDRDQAENIKAELFSKLSSFNFGDRGDNWIYPYPHENKNDYMVQSTKSWIADKIIEVNETLIENEQKILINDKEETEDNGNSNEDEFSDTRQIELESKDKDIDLDDQAKTNRTDSSSLIEKEEFPSFKELIKTGPDAQTEDQQSETSNLIYFYIALGLAVFLIGVVLIRKKLLSRSSS